MAIIRTTVDAIGLSLPPGDADNADRVQRVRRAIIRLVEVLELNLVRSRIQGATFTAESAGDLSRVYENIGSEVGYEEVKKETTATWAGYGLAFAVLAALAAVSLGARWP